MRKIAFVLLLVLAGCTTAAITVPTCPPLPAYSAEFQRGVAEELKALPPHSGLRVMIEDYGHLRKQCRTLNPQ